MSKAKVYIHLFHGRNSIDEDMDDWGFDGPLFGPFTHVQSTYGSTVKAWNNVSGNDAFLDVVKGCVYYDGKYYGDFTTFVHDEDEEMNPNIKCFLEEYDQEKANLPSKEWRKKAKKMLEDG